jgi:hypothetical protein
MEEEEEEEKEEEYCVCDFEVATLLPIALQKAMVASIAGCQAAKRLGLPVQEAILVQPSD